MQVVHYTDPGCPFAFSAEPHRLRLTWTFGDQLQWTTRMIVLAEQPTDYESKGITPAKMAKGFAKLQAEHGMPIDVSERPRLAATLPACRAVVATRLYRPELADALLRRLRVRAMGQGGLLDDPAMVDAAATDVGLDPTEIAAWMQDDATEQALREDMGAARRPLPAALMLDHKLAPAGDGSGGRRYTAPSLELHAGEQVAVVPGFQPWESYELAIANLDPTLIGRDAPGDIEELLTWAPYPLATVEVAAIMQQPVDAVRAQLKEISTFQPAGEDGFWSLDD